MPDRVSDDLLTDAVKVLSASVRVCVVGFGPSRHLAAYGAHQFQRMGIESTVMGQTGRGFAEDLMRLSHGDAIVLLAYDGAGAETDVLFEQAEKLEVPVVQLSENLLSADHRAAVALAAGRGRA